MPAMRRTFRSRGGLPWWHWRRVANRLARVAEAAAEPEWVAGTNSSIAISPDNADRLRITATDVASGNPRASKQYDDLDVGATYRVQATGYAGTSTGGTFFRVSADADLTNGDYVNSGGTGAIDVTFTAPAGGTVYIGLVAVCDTNGQYAEISDALVVEKQ